MIQSYGTQEEMQTTSESPQIQKTEGKSLAGPAQTSPERDPLRPQEFPHLPFQLYPHKTHSILYGLTYDTVNRIMEELSRMYKYECKSRWNVEISEARASPASYLWT